MSDRVSPVIVQVVDDLVAAKGSMRRATRQLLAALPGYPSSSGSGGGGGGMAMTIDDERVPVTAVEALALGPADQATADLARLRKRLRFVVTESFALRDRPYVGAWSDDPVILTDMALIAVDGLDVHVAAVWQLDGIRNAAIDIRGLAEFWGRSASKRDRDAVSSDAVEGCRVHAGHGLGFVPAHRLGACAWCYGYRQTWGHFPPRTLIDMHDRGMRISARQVLDHDPIARQAAARRAKRQECVSPHTGTPR